MNHLWTILAEFWTVLGEMAPYLLFGFFVAGLLSIFISAQTVERHLGGKGAGPVLKASFWGVPMPLCSCSVIPVATSLRKHGASKGATTAFLLSTPQTGVDSIFVTYSLLGPVFAIFRPLVAFVTGLFGGYLVEAFGNGDVARGDGRVEPCEDECCHPTSKASRFVRGLRYGFVTLPRDIGKELIIGLAIAGLITALVPADLFADLLRPGLVQMLVMMALGIPIYVCATASVPIAAALIAKGVSPGAAFVFLMTGPATNAATILTLRKLLGWKSAAIYLGTIAVAALGGGVLLDWLFVAAGVPQVHMGHAMLPGYVNTAAALVLLAVLGFALFGGGRQGNDDHDHTTGDGSHEKETRDHA
ncbi:MAG: SO_0444 family Cu/Zn efflux transporter [Kiritimatiellae bacterium]|nr:SO_0444 family Cu/Zn efflux transporter [Kiritimatiellia bacterium]